MASAGLDAVWLTDHSNSQGSMDCEDVEDCPNQGPELTEGDWPVGVWPGSEISPWAGEDSRETPTGHVGCLPLNGQGFSTEAFIDRPAGTVTGSQAIEQCQQAGGYAILNHPFGPTSWVAFDWTTESFDAMEIFNGGGGFDPSDEAAVEAWLQGRADGQDWVPVGASDSHAWSTEAPGTLLQAALGWPRTELGLVGDESPIEALAAGRTILGDPSSALRFWATRGSDVVGPGGALEGSMTLHIEASTLESGMRLQVLRLPDEVIEERELGADSVHWCIEVESSALYTARVWPAGGGAYLQRGVSIANAIELR